MAKANYDLPNEMIERVRKLSGARTKREALVVALQAYLQQKKLDELIHSYGKVSLRWTRKSLQKYRQAR